MPKARLDAATEIRILCADVCCGGEIGRIVSGRVRARRIGDSQSPPAGWLVNEHYPRVACLLPGINRRPQDDVWALTPHALKKFENAQKMGRPPERYTKFARPPIRDAAAIRLFEQPSGTDHRVGLVPRQLPVIVECPRCRLQQQLSAAEIRVSVGFIGIFGNHGSQDAAPAPYPD